MFHINNDWNISLKSIMDDLGRRTIEHLRKRQSLKLMFGSINTTDGISLPQYLCQATVRVVGQSRHSKCFIPPQCRTDVYKNSLLPCTVLEWNALHPDLMDCSSVDSFFNRLNQPHYLLLVFFYMFYYTWFDGAYAPFTESTKRTDIINMQTNYQGYQ